MEQLTLVLLKTESKFPNFFLTWNRFHGKGTLFFKGYGRYEAEWNQGIVLQGKYYFSDGLEYSTQWDYCTGLDRRFYGERLNGIKPVTEDQIKKRI